MTCSLNCVLNERPLWPTFYNEQSIYLSLYIYITFIIFVVLIVFWYGVSSFVCYLDVDVFKYVGNFFLVVRNM